MGKAGLSKLDYERTGAETVGIVCTVGKRKITLKAVTELPYSCYEYEETKKKTKKYRCGGIQDLSVETIIMKYRELKYHKYQITKMKPGKLLRSGRLAFCRI